MFSLKFKLTALVGFSCSMIFLAACQGGGGGGGDQQPQQIMKEICPQLQRVCKDGRPAERMDEGSCYQKCPEDNSTATTTMTATETATQTTTSFRTNTSVN